PRTKWTSSSRNGRCGWRTARTRREPARAGRGGDGGRLRFQCSRRRASHVEGRVQGREAPGRRRLQGGQRGLRLPVRKCAGHLQGAGFGQRQGGEGGARGEIQTVRQGQLQGARGQGGRRLLGGPGKVRRRGRQRQGRLREGSEGRRGRREGGRQGAEDRRPGQHEQRRGA